MTIQRQYTLPNCKLVVEGLSDGATATAPRPVVSMVTNAECHFAGQPKPISGGRAFLEDLAITASNYAQGILSGVPHPHTQPGQGELVSLERVEPDLHRLTVKPDSFVGEANGGGSSAPVQIDLRTVQLFDLVEAIDQFLADSQTLPEFALQLAPVSRRYAVTHEPMTKQVVPAAIGLAGLAAAAAALFFLPIPERRPEAAEDAATPAPLVSPASPAASPPTGLPTPLASPVPVESPSPVQSPDTTISDSASAASPSPAASPENASPETGGSVGEALVNANEITEPEQLDRLKTQLRDRLDDAWSQRPTFTEDLVYQVSVAENGDILGFRYMNNAAVQYAHQTPLPDLQYRQTNRSVEPNALFRVVFTPGGVVQVSPWHGRPPE
ncbi:DUF4335 domain-containing protein [Leptolyngbya sp. O-77]|uniref:DUF4335 domain-containing protein n=1 Tax=Leptolyngbya sp. O-77 TaxID=1080068 RepID=UPI00074D28F8|nr:DUF4335 domain-containing protein [Leptolyngbya sp. O-77]BAU42340.1 hypothetical protein O77CONTIG1_02161 [Leptolyngbya sp. O-77]